MKTKKMQRDSKIRRVWGLARPRVVSSVAGVLMAFGLMGGAHAEPMKTIKIAIIDPFSGPFGPVGTLNAQIIESVIQRVNAAKDLGNYQLQLVPFDDKLNPSIALVDAQKAADEGIRYIMQGNGSNVSFALIDWLQKHNRMNPQNKMLYFNYAAADPGLSNEDCGFYHFNFAANANMQMAALVSYIAEQKNIKKIFLINMDYSAGHSFADTAEIMLKKELPDVKIVGDVFTPIGQTKDYTPFIYKIKESGAQAVITSNWGPDMSLLAKAAGQNGLKNVPIFSFYGGVPGTPQAIGDDGAGVVMQLSAWVSTVGGEEETYAEAFRKQYHNDWYYGEQVFMIGMLAKAIREAGTDDPTQVALHLEGMHYASPTGDVYMRADNNSAVMPLYFSVLEKGSPSLEGTDLHWQVVKRVPAIRLMLPTSCKMDRPAGAVLPNAYYGTTGQ